MHSSASAETTGTFLHKPKLQKKKKKNLIFYLKEKKKKKKWFNKIKKKI